MSDGLDIAAFRHPSREFGILPFWFLNGELDPDEMLFQLRELRDKRMHGVVFHGRFGLEMPYLGDSYLERVKLAVDEAGRLGLAAWIYDEMNWPSGTADKRVLAERPDLAQRYIECLGFTIQGPWFMCLTGADSRYLDFERSTPVAAFAIGEDGAVIDLSPNLSFENVVPWEVPPGTWQLMYIVEKRADYYIDALDPESTETFLRVGYEPYVRAVGEGFASKVAGFYSDEPAMHYYVSAGDNAIVPWTKDMFRRFRDRNGYDLRPRLPDLFYDLAPDSARVRFDFYSTTTELYSQAYYGQIQDWCRKAGVTFTAHLLYEEWLRRVIRVEGNLMRHYERMDVVAVDHLYPVIGTRESPDQHVAMKVASSAAHHVGSARVICESFGGIFMDATMQRMKWIADWEYVLGVNQLNPHGFHYTLEGARKRDWPPSQFYQYPWWHYYGVFSDYITRLSSMLSGGRHVAKVALLWPINAMFATFRPQEHTPLGDRMEQDFNALTDLLLRLHQDFDYLDEDVLADAEVGGGVVRVRDEAYELVVVPPMSHVKLGTVDALERFAATGGRLLGAVLLPATAFGQDGLDDVAPRMAALFGVDVSATLDGSSGVEVVIRDQPGGGRTVFVRTDAIARPAGSEEAEAVTKAMRDAIGELIDPDVELDNQELFCLHRVKDGQDLFFVVNPTFQTQRATMTISGEVEPMLWDPTLGEEHPIVPSEAVRGHTRFLLELVPVGSCFILPTPARTERITAADVTIDATTDGGVEGYGPAPQAHLQVERGGRVLSLQAQGDDVAGPFVLGGEWDFEPLDPNALVVGNWLGKAEVEETAPEAYTGPEIVEHEWLPVVNGAWGYQLPGGSAEPFPFAVWYRVAFDVERIPKNADLLVDGFAGSDQRVYVNGRPVETQARRSHFDSQMRALPIGDLLQSGRNVLTVRLVLEGPTDGILDLVKLVGDFALAGAGGGYRIAEPRPVLQPASWTEQGYPFLSGRGRYQRAFFAPDGLEGQRLFLEVPVRDDVVEVVVNGAAAGVRLWDPYVVEVTDYVRSGENTVEITIANTPVNLLEGVERPSGLAGPPRLVPKRRFVFDLSHASSARAGAEFGGGDG